MIRVAVLTISDRCSRGEQQDTSGPALATLCTERLNATIAERATVPDEADVIEARLRGCVDSGIDLVLTTGGTGLGPRDVTPEASARVIERPHPALLELARARALPHTPKSFLSRGVAGATARTLIINLPGSQRGSTETLEALLDVLPHAIGMLHGEGH
jgi:molybdenum cofactor synthesis domain-containing protein